MFDVQYHFYNFLENLAYSYYQNVDNARMETEFATLSPSPRYPYMFFKWFFTFEKVNSSKPHPFFSGGQKLFIDFFKDLHLSFTFGMDEVKEHRMVSNNIHYVEYYQYDEYASTPTPHKQKFHFEQLLDELLEKEAKKFEKLIREGIRSFNNIEQLQASLSFLYGEVMNLERISIDEKDYDLLFADRFNRYKDQFGHFIAANTPVLTKVNHTEHSQLHESNQKIRYIFENLKLNDQAIFDKRRTKIEDLTGLVLRKDYSKKVYFNCNQGALVYIFEKLKLYVGTKPDKKMICEGECLWYMSSDEYFPVANVNSYDVAKSRAAADLKKAVDDFFNGL